MTTQYDVLGIGNAIVDVVGRRMTHFSRATTCARVR